MPIRIEIVDDDLKGFSDPAKSHLREVTEQYSASLIEESNRIEAGRNAGNGPAEITQGMVADAAHIMRRGLGAPKTKIGLRLLRIFAAILSLCVGIMYDENKLQDSGYMLLFVLIIGATILAVTISTWKE